MVSDGKKYSASSFGKVAVMMGGTSAERLISLESGEAVLAALRSRDIDAEAFDTREQALTELIDANFDRVFIALHGRGGEDGVIQGALESLKLPYSGSGILGSALALDKIRSKQVWLSCGLPTPEFVQLEKNSDWAAIIEQLGLPIMVKPVREGSSLGASKVKSLSDFKPAWEQAVALDDQVIAERWIEGGGEFTIPVLNGQVLPMIQLKTPREFYDYKAKYESDTTEYICPCGLSETKEVEIGELALQAFDVLDCSGWGRVDVLLDADQKVWLIEVNTVPGMTSHSLVPMAAMHSGIEFDELVIRILMTTFSEQDGMTI